MQKAEGLALRLAVLFRLLLLSLPVGCSRSSSMAAGWGSYRRQRRLGRRLLCAHRRMRIRVRADLCFSTPPISIVFLSKSVFAPLIPAIGYRAVLALSGYVLNNNLVFVLAAVYFYKLSNLILKDSKASLLASVLFCFNPASVFYSQYIQRAYMLYLHFVEYSIYFLIQILWQCSCLVYPAQLGQMEQLMPVISVSRHCVRLMMPSPRRELLDMQCRLLLVELQALFACLFHLLFSKLMDTTISVCLLLQMCYHPGASQEFLICMVIFKVITGNPMYPRRKNENKAKTSENLYKKLDSFIDVKQGYDSLLVFPFILHLGFMTFMAIFVMYVQVATRFLSASPPIYWFASYMMLSPGTTQRIISHLVWSFFIAYILLGSLLFSNFYPFT